MQFIFVRITRIAGFPENDRNIKRDAAAASQSRGCCWKRQNNSI